MQKGRVLDLSACSAPLLPQHLAGGAGTRLSEIRCGVRSDKFNVFRADAVLDGRMSLTCRRTLACRPRAPGRACSTSIGTSILNLSHLREQIARFACRHEELQVYHVQEGTAPLQHSVLELFHRSPTASGPKQCTLWFVALWPLWYQRARHRRTANAHWDNY